MAAPPPETIAGLIERVTYFNEETGFAVLKVQAKGHRDLVAVLGTMPAVSAGEWVTAEGVWNRDREHGLQFKATQLRSVPPSSPEGIEKYLGSGMVKGIGPVYAKKLVGKFGEKIFDIIDNYSARLEEVEGIGHGRRAKIKQAWTEQKQIREIMVFLHSHGVSTSRAVRIFKTYGNEAIEKVRANPYALARDIHGIGFKTADQIAGRVGIPFDSAERACAGLEHVLAEARHSGHCALPRPMLLEQSAQLLQVAPSVVGNALESLLAREELVLDRVEGEDLIYLPEMIEAERGIAARIAALARQAVNYPAIDFEKALAWAGQKTGRELAPSQVAALRQALASPVAVITGGPGVGKTTLVNTLLLILRAKKVRCLLCAPTGRAAKRLSESAGMEARTIHRLLEFQRTRFTRDERNPLECDLLVVDEASMIDVPLLHALLKAHPPGAGLVLIGDVDQLPSVGPGTALRDMIESGVVPVVRLTEVFRQAAQSRIVTAAHQINLGQLPELAGKDEESDFYFVEREEAEQIRKTLLEVVCKRAPAKFGLDPVRDVQVLCPMNKGTLGVRELNQVLQGALNPLRPEDFALEKFGWQFRERDKVMQTENNYDKEVYNGDIGQISKIDPVEQEVRVRYDQREVTYEFGEMDELALAYAITIHKSQGSEFPAVVIPVATQHFMMLQRNLVYTGITRGKRLMVLVGQRKALQVAVANNKTADRFSGLLPRLRLAAG